MISDQSKGHCPCGSGKAYEQCCQPWHQGKPAPSPEALMRSRYTAFVQKRVDYLLETWHPDTRPAELDMEGSPAWVSLQILDSTGQGNRGVVHFRAVYRIGDGWGYLEEHSDFVREEGRWYYLSGETEEGQLKPGRNDRCPCGSGKKFKACCR
ncbi:SEC-C domain-containing protein [Marinobacter pelagius]|uniref:YchJ family protein n=1 Tax=Marinobacter sp. C7 TaxID=2951363 RepID=UPI001EF0E16F|nr:YchJ family metal-binding protein [Marinobacter sp. C7]MCG7200646.1 SEC-C domain-containing protein [Marinobacter sp. C7]